MEFEESPELVRRMMRALAERDAGRWGRPGDFSVTELLICPIRAYWRRQGEPGLPSDTSLLIRFLGRVAHQELEFMPVREVRVERDGIVGHPDMLYEREPIELFSTRLSPRRAASPASFPLKVRQVMAYCWMLRVERAWLVVVYLRGVAGRLPSIKAWRLSFTARELRENWQRLLSAKRLLEESLAAGEPPDFRGEAWECEYCGYTSLCYPVETEWL